MKRLCIITISLILTACAAPIDTSIFWSTPTAQSLDPVELVPLYTLEVTREYPYSLALSPDGDWLALADTAQLTVYAVGDTLQEHWSMEIENGGSALDFSPDGNQLASQSGDVIHIWDVHTGELMQSITTNFESLGHIAFSPDGSMLAYSDRSSEPLTEILDLQSITVIQSLKDSGSLIWESNSDLLIYGSHELILWDIVSGQQLTQFGQPYFESSFPGPKRAVRVNQRGISVAEFKYSSFVIWDNRRDEWGQPNTFRTPLSEMAWAETQELLAVGFQDGTILIWDTVKNRPVLRLDTGVDSWVESLLWRQGDTSLISEANGVISLWEIDDK